MYGWEWRYPGCEESVYAFPEVIIGAKPWSRVKDVGSILKYKVNGYKSLVATFDTITWDTRGSFNLMLSGWTTRIKRTSGNPIPNQVSAEISFVLYKQNLGGATGKRVGSLKLDGVQWKVMR